MPVSLMTAYFSTQLTGVEFTLKSYWICFGVILGITIVGLLIFSLASGMMERKLIYRPFSRIIFDASKGFLVRRKRKSY